MKALILIDVQKGFDDPSWGSRNNRDAESKIQMLLDHWREKCWPIFHIQHLSLEKNSPLQSYLVGSHFKDFVKVRPGEKTIQKQVNSAFIGTDLEHILKQDSISELAFVGFTTDHCVSTSVRMASNLGFKVWVIADATTTFQRELNGRIFSADHVHQISLASLNKEFAKIVESRDFII